MQPISLTNKQASSGGCYGRYYKIDSKIGLKVLRGKGSGSIDKLLRSRQWREAKREAKLLELAQATGIVPKCYGVFIVEKDGRFFAGIAMQHLGNTTLGESSISYWDIAEDVNDKLDSVGIAHGDLHDENMMVYRNKIYVIDFGLAYQVK